MANKRQIRICWSEKTNGLIDLNNPLFCGDWFDNKDFQVPDSNEDVDLEQAWKRRCSELDEKYPDINHFVHHRYVPVKISNENVGDYEWSFDAIITGLPVEFPDDE